MADCSQYADGGEMLDAILTNSNPMDAGACVIYSVIPEPIALAIIFFTIGIALAIYNRGIMGVAAIAIIMSGVIFPQVPAIATNVGTVLISIAGLVGPLALYYFYEPGFN